jgi:hypothetical protein
MFMAALMRIAMRQVTNLLRAEFRGAHEFRRPYDSRIATPIVSVRQRRHRLAR